MPKTTMNLRVDASLKKDAEKVIDELGLSMSAAITIYLKMIVREKGLPFEVKVKRSAPTSTVKKASRPEDDDDLFDLDLDGDDSIRKAIEKL